MFALNEDASVLKAFAKATREGESLSSVIPDSTHTKYSKNYIFWKLSLKKRDF